MADWPTQAAEPAPGGIAPRIQRWIERNAFRLARGAIVGVIAVFLVSQLVDPLEDWLAGRRFFEIAVLALAAELWAQMVSVRTLTRESRDDLARVIADETTFGPLFISAIHAHKPERARLLELSSASVQEILTALSNVGTDVSLLIQHPSAATTEFQTNRIRQRIDELPVAFSGGGGSLSVRLYRTPASLRLRLLDRSLVAVGWYTYSQDNIGVYGHNNPIVLATSGESAGIELIRMAERAFERLWTHPDTVHLDDYMPD